MCVCVCVRVCVILLLLQMDKGMIHGCDVYVDFASAENGFFELPPEAASEPWAQIGRGGWGEEGARF